MILLDTNVVSEAMKPEPHPSVCDWLDAQAAKTLSLQRHHRRTVVRHPRAAARQA